MTTKIPSTVTFTCRSIFMGHKRNDLQGCGKKVLVDATTGDEQVVICPHCRIPYEVWIRQVRHARSRKGGDKNFPVREYNMRVYRPDGREELIQFTNGAEPVFLDAKSGDPLVFVFGPFGMEPDMMDLVVNGDRWFGPKHTGRYARQTSNQGEHSKTRTLVRRTDMWTLIAVANQATGQQGDLHAN